MSAAAHVIAKLGGTRPAAELLRVPPSTVQSWKSSGVIPSRRQTQILNLAREKGIDLKPEDFFAAAEAA